MFTSQPVTQTEVIPRPQDEERKEELQITGWVHRIVTPDELSAPQLQQQDLSSSLFEPEGYVNDAFTDTSNSVPSTLQFKCVCLHRPRETPLHLHFHTLTSAACIWSAAHAFPRRSALTQMAA